MCSNTKTCVCYVYINVMDIYYIDIHHTHTPLAATRIHWDRGPGLCLLDVPPATGTCHRRGIR